jgi:hypothetical protein
MPVSDMDAIIPIYDAIQIHRNEYDSGDTDYSVTTLLDPPRVVHLNKRHVKDVDLWIQDLMHSFDGTASHSYLEYCLNKVDGGTKYKCEERFGANILNRKVSGAYDIFWKDDLSLWDLKKTSTWKAMFGSKDDWTAQQNMYRYLIWFHKKIELRHLNIMAWFRDWSKYNKMRYGAEYPGHPIMLYRLPNWDFGDTYNFMETRVQLLKDHEETADDDLPLCSFEDMWCSPDKVAVKSTKRKNALRVCDDQAAASKWMSELLAKPDCKHKRANLYYDVRLSERTRCEAWCPVNLYCNQYNDHLKAVALGGK